MDCNDTFSTLVFNNFTPFLKTPLPQWLVTCDLFLKTMSGQNGDWTYALCRQGHSFVNTHPNNNYWRFRSSQLYCQFPTIAPYISIHRPVTASYKLYHAFTEAPVVGRVAWPGGDGNRTRNLQIAGRETGSPDHSATQPPTISPCWFLHMLLYYRCVVNRMWLKGNERKFHHFTKHECLRLKKCINLTAQNNWITKCLRICSELHFRD